MKVERGSRKSAIGPRDPLAFLGSFGSLLLAVAFVLVSSFAIAWPLWAFATSNRKLFSACLVALFGLFLAFIFMRGIIRRLRRKPSAGTS